MKYLLILLTSISSCGYSPSPERIREDSIANVRHIEEQHWRNHNLPGKRIKAAIIDGKSAYFLLDDGTVIRIGSYKYNLRVEIDTSHVYKNLYQRVNP